MTISMLDLGWAAGFLEGEGHFRFDCSPRIMASQNEPEPLHKLQKLFGGKITQRKTGNALSDNRTYIWDLPAQESACVMMTLFTLMSERRKVKIEDALNKWKKTRLIRKKDSEYCVRGHKLEEGNIYEYRGYKKCLACKKHNQKFPNQAIGGEKYRRENLTRKEKPELTLEDLISS